MYPSYIKIKQTIRQIFDAVTSVDNNEDADAWQTIALYDMLGRRVDDANVSGCFIEVRTNGRHFRSIPVIR